MEPSPCRACGARREGRRAACSVRIAHDRLRNVRGLSFASSPSFSDAASREPPTQTRHAQCERKELSDASRDGDGDGDGDWSTGPPPASAFINVTHEVRHRRRWVQFRHSMSLPSRCFPRINVDQLDTHDQSRLDDCLKSCDRLDDERCRRANR